MRKLIAIIGGCCIIAALVVAVSMAAGIEEKTTVAEQEIGDLRQEIASLREQLRQLMDTQDTPQATDHRFGSKDKTGWSEGGVEPAGTATAADVLTGKSFHAGSEWGLKWGSMAGLPSGTSGQTLRHDGTSWIANSFLFNDGTRIGIGTISPVYRLHIVDSVAGTTGWVHNIHDTGDGLLGSGSNSLTYASSGSGDGLLGTSDAGYGVIGSYFDGVDVNRWGALGTRLAGVYGAQDSTDGFGIWGINSHLNGTGVVGAGNNLASHYLVGGSGGAFSSTNIGVYGYGDTTTLSWGVYGRSEASSRGTGVIGIATATDRGVGLKASSGGSSVRDLPTDQDAGVFGMGKYYGLVAIAERITAGSEGRGVVGLGNNDSIIPGWHGMGVLGVSNGIANVCGVMGVGQAINSIGVVGVGRGHGTMHFWNGSGVSGTGFHGTTGYAIDVAGEVNAAIMGEAANPTVDWAGYFHGDIRATGFSHKGVPGGHGSFYADGNFKTVYKTPEGYKVNYAITSPDVEVYVSGTTKLGAGKSSIKFDSKFRHSVSKHSDIKVIVTPINSWSGIYVTAITSDGFTVNSNTGDPGAELHWIAIGKRKGYEEKADYAAINERMVQAKAIKGARTRYASESQSLGVSEQKKVDMLTVEQKQIKKITVPNNEEMGLLKIEKEWSGWGESEPVKLHRDTEIQQIMLEIERLNQRVKNLQKSAF